MSAAAHISPQVEPGRPKYDGRPELREDVVENLALAAWHSELARNYASIGDDPGLGYALRCALAHFKSALGSFNDIARASKAAEGS